MDAVLFYGVSLEWKTKYTMVTKYNEDTGKPYQKRVADGSTRYIEGTDIEFEEVSDDKYDELADMEMFFGEYLFGISVARVDSHGDDLETVDIDDNNTLSRKLFEATQGRLTDKTVHGLAANAKLQLGIFRW